MRAEHVGRRSRVLGGQEVDERGREVRQEWGVMRGMVKEKPKA